MDSGRMSLVTNGGRAKSTAGTAVAHASVARAAAKGDARFRGLLKEFVGMAFYQPMLAQARNTTLKSEQLHGGRGEEVFGGRFDAIVAQRMAEADQPGIADALYRSLTPGLSCESVL